MLIDRIIFEGERVIIKGVIPIKPSINNAEMQSANTMGSSAHYGIATTETYLHDRNSVEELRFEVIKPIVKVKAIQVISEVTRQKLSAASQRRWMKAKAVTSVGS